MPDNTSFEERRDRRTIDKVLNQPGCSIDGTHCGDHTINMYRIQLLEEAKDDLCRSTIANNKQTSKNILLMRAVGTILSICAVFIMAATGIGWQKLIEFTEKVYVLREADHDLFGIYKLEAQKYRLKLREEVKAIEKRVERLENDNNR